MSESIRREEYHYSSLGTELWSAPNRSQDLRSRVDRRGIEVFPRETNASGEGAAWELRLGTASFGRVGGVWPVPSRAISVDGERAELDHGRLIEWFVNDERGIAQGWTIANRPPGVELLVIGLAIDGDLSLRLDEGGRSGIFVDAAGTARARYRNLVAWDASNRKLSAWLQPGPAGVELRVDDAEAVYPITVDPLITNPAWTAESNQADAGFGRTVAAAGDVNGDGYSDVLVGAGDYDGGETDEGRVFVYHGSASGLAANAAWTAESNQANANFGCWISTAGDVNGDGYSDVIVGACQYDGGETDEGRAYVYHGSASGLAAGASWTAESNQVDALFGIAVSTAGDVNGDGYSDVIVGARAFGNGQFEEGGAFVYHGSASGLAASADWTAESNQADARFGEAVSAAGDVNGDGYSDVIVGAYLYDDGQSNEGRVFVYHGSASGLGGSAAWLKEGEQTDAQFGRAISAGDFNGDGYSDVVVGAHVYDSGQSNEGKVFAYYGSMSGLGTADWTAEENQANANFGRNLSSAGDVNGDGYSDVIVGAFLYDNGQNNEGRAFVYHGSSSGLGSSAAWSAESNQADARFGLAVSTAGDVNGDGYSDVIVGAYWYDNGETDEGRAYVYHGSAAGVSATEAWTAESNQADAGLRSVSTAGDVNGDGYSDVIVGAVGYDNGETNEGRAFVYHGSATGLATTAAWTAESNLASVFFGWSVSSAGDVNGDGYSDVIVGAIKYGNGGRAYVYLGSPTGLSAIEAWTAESNQVDAAFGISVSTAGDVNGDGYSDVIVGAVGYDNGQSDEGRAYVYLGSPTGLSAIEAWTAESNQVDAGFGISVSTAGDVNGDGYSDVIVGAVQYGNGGRAYVYHGSAAGLSTTAAWTAGSNQVNANFGHSVSTADDVNGDGYSDVIVGASGYDNGESNEGRAYVYHGSPTGLSAIEAWTAESNQADAGFGLEVSSAGDVNGDGYSDVIVGARKYSNGQSEEGRAYVYQGSVTGLSTTEAWTAESNQADAEFGSSVSTAGDVNGDGYSDVIVAAWIYDNGQSDEGRAYVYYGNGGGGPGHVLQQRRANGSAPIAVLGRTPITGKFRVYAEFPVGAGGLFPGAEPGTLVFFEWEVKPFGDAFDGKNVERSVVGLPLPTMGGTLTFDELVTPPVPKGKGKIKVFGGFSFHWRARLVTTSALFPASAWFSVPGNNVTEAKLGRVGP